jgi:hypothetical protein
MLRPFGFPLLSVLLTELTFLGAWAAATPCRKLRPYPCQTKFLLQTLPYEQHPS